MNSIGFHWISIGFQWNSSGTPLDFNGAPLDSSGTSLTGSTEILLDSSGIPLRFYWIPVVQDGATDNQVGGTWKPTWSQHGEHNRFKNRSVLLMPLGINVF